MFDYNKEAATSKQLWKINFLADKAFSLQVEAEVKEHGEMISKAKDAAFTITLPISKQQAHNWIKLLNERVAGLESLIESLDKDRKAAVIMKGDTDG
tara:strand:+ start:278 stop:568 length:291 start_codon:yes stop_codon:yes gene_type:complete